MLYDCNTDSDLDIKSHRHGINRSQNRMLYLCLMVNCMSFCVGDEE